MKSKWKEKEWIILTAIAVLYLIFNGVLLAGHELWRDEANVWLFARDASLSGLFAEIKYQGHPCLWYLIVMPFAKLGFPFKTISVLSYLIMALAAGIFVYKAPFHPLTKAVCLFSPAFSYYYPVVARNYCLIALLLILLAYTYSERYEKPMRYGVLLALLVQADTIALAAAGLISLMWLWEGAGRSFWAWREGSRKQAEGSLVQREGSLVQREGSLDRREGSQKQVEGSLIQAAKGLWLPLASLLLWIAEFYQVSDSPEYRMNVLPIREMAGEIRNFSYHILTRMTGLGEGFDLFLILLFLAAGVLIAVRVRNFWPVVIMAGSFLFEVIFSIMVYQLHIWHYIALFFTLIFVFWVSCTPKARAGSVLAQVLLVILGVTMFLRWNSPEESSSLSNALSGVYSDGIYTAAYIRENVAPEELILSTDVSEASTVQAYLGRSYTFYYAGNLEAATYARYDEEQSQSVTWETLLARIREKYPEKTSFYLLMSPGCCISDIPQTARQEWELLYETGVTTARGENYSLYRITVAGE